MKLLKRCLRRDDAEQEVIGVKNQLGCVGDGGTDGEKKRRQSYSLTSNSKDGEATKL